MKITKTKKRILGCPFLIIAHVRDKCRSFKILSTILCRKQLSDTYNNWDKIEKNAMLKAHFRTVKKLSKEINVL
jgi:hypothetical protein